MLYILELWNILNNAVSVIVIFIGLIAILCLLFLALIKMIDYLSNVYTFFSRIIEYSRNREYYREWKKQLYSSDFYIKKDKRTGANMYIYKPKPKRRN